jgi:hypothetical protein
MVMMNIEYKSHVMAQDCIMASYEIPHTTVLESQPWGLECARLRLIECLHDAPDPGFVPERGIMG